VYEDPLILQLRERIRPCQKQDQYSYFDFIHDIPLLSGFPNNKVSGEMFAVYC